MVAIICVTRFERHRLVSGARLHQVHPANDRDTFTLSATVLAETAPADDSGLPPGEQIAALETLIAAERDRAASERHLSPSAFGESARALFAKWGLAVNSYQFMNEPNVTEIEYSLRGPGSGFFSALHEIHASHRLWDVRLAQIRNLYPRNALDVVLRVRTERHPSGSDEPVAPSPETASPHPVAGIARNYFPPAPPAPRPAPAPPREPPPPVPAPAQTERVPWLEYVGRVSDDGGNRFVYVKNTRTGEMLKLEQSGEGNMRYAASATGGILAYVDGHVYEISRR